MADGPPLPEPAARTVFGGDRPKAERLVPLVAAVAAASPQAALLGGGLGSAAPAVAALVGAFAAEQAIGFLRPRRLTVDRGGVSWSGPRRWSVAWADVARIRRVRVGGGAVFVVDRRGAGDGPRGRPRPLVAPATLRASPEDVLAAMSRELSAARAEGRAPPDDGASGPALEGVLGPRWAIPWVSLAIVAVLAGVFAAEVLFPAGPARGPLKPSVATLRAFGGASRALTVGGGQWFRVMLVPLLHVDIDHLAGNAIDLLWAGWALESLVGRCWFLAIYAAGGLGSAALSLAVSDPTTIDIGASGAVAALSGALLTLSLRFRGATAEGLLRGWAIGLLAPALFPVTRHYGEFSVNVAGHAGGAAAGAALGLLLLWRWDRTAAVPPGRRVAAAVAALAAAASLASAWADSGGRDAVRGYARAVRSLEAGDLAEAQRAADAAARATPDAGLLALAGEVAFLRGDARGGAATLDAAYRLAPKPRVLALRGLARFYAGDPGAAKADLARAAADGADDLYPLIWLAVVRGRAGGAPGLAPAELARAPAAWPRPVADMFAGLVTPAALRAMAARRGPGDVCEADLYLAERDRVRGADAEARDGFARALRECPPGFDESGMARMELAAALPRGVSPPPAGPASP